MIKKVKTADLRLGMYIHDFNCDKSPDIFHIEKSLLISKKTLNILNEWGVEEVLIDTEKGVDVKRISGSPGLKGSKLTPDQPHVNLEVVQEEVRRDLAEAFDLKNEAVDLINKSMDSILKGDPPDIERGLSLVKKMKVSIKKNSDALILLTRIRRKDEYTLQHSVSVGALMLGMCNSYNISGDVTLSIALGGLFHDIGKTLVPHSILNKPGKLTDIEMELMKKHTQFSLRILNRCDDLPPEVADVALHHHERYDGSGYPEHLRGPDISFAARLASICDVFDAITSVRCYKEGMGTVDGLKVVYENAGTLFDKKMAHDFIRFIGVYPVGSCVRLQNGLTGIVVKSTQVMAKPVIKVVYDSGKRRRIKPYLLDLSQSEDISISHYEKAEKFRISPAEIVNEITTLQTQH